MPCTDVRLEDPPSLSRMGDKALSVPQLQMNLVGIGDVLRASPLSVPVYQRSYAWKERHVQELLDDLASAMQNGEPEYFLGSIVLTEAQGRRQVVDGQQRLATVTMFIAAVRDYFHSNDEDKKANSIEHDFLASLDVRTEELEPRLTLNSMDNEFFRSQIIAAPDKRVASDSGRESHRRISDAFRLAKDRVHAIATAAGESAATNAIMDWIDYIQSKAKVITVRVPDDLNAFTIFETLNDRGLTLAISDLLKNYLFSKAGSRLSEVQAAWTGMQSNLESIGEEEVIVDFIRHLWSSKNGLTRERELYKKIRDAVSNCTKAIQFAQELEAEARTYCALVNADHPYWRAHGDTVRGFVATFNVLRVEQVRPLLLAVLAKFKTGQVEKAFRLITSCIVRVLVAGIRGGTIESLYATLARDVSNGAIKNENALRTQMKTAIPSDTEFQDAFERASVSKSYLARYYLREIERCANTAIPEWTPSRSIEDVTLEHVLPQRIDNVWGVFDEDSHRSFVRRIGNLAILAADDNVDVANKSFTEKKKAYKRSSFETTKCITNVSEWTQNAILQRQHQLAALAVKTWPISGDVCKRRTVTKAAKDKTKKGTVKENAPTRNIATVKKKGR
jgi:hypothetical protein